MSVETITWALKQPISHSSAKFVLVVLANQANSESGLSHPSVAYLAESTGQDRKTVMANLRRLSDWGVIADSGARVGATKQVVVYRLNSTENGTVKSGNKNNSTENGTVPDKSKACDGKSAEIGTVKQSQKRDTEPRAKSKSKSKSDARENLALPVWLLPSDWQDWCDHRNVGKAKFSAKAQELSLRTLTRLRDAGHKPTDIIELAIERGWQGLFAPRSERGSQHATHRESASERVARINAEAERREAAEHAGNVIEGAFRVG